MSRRKTQAELDREAEENDAAEAAKYQRISECAERGHNGCYPTEWYWSGHIQTMYCPSCGESEWRSEPED